MITVNGTLRTIAGNAAEQGELVVQLCGYGAQVPTVPGSGLLARLKAKPVAAAADGTFSVQLTGNDRISPAGTYYTFAVMDDNGDTAQVNAYEVVGADRAVDLSTLPNFDPTGVLVAPLPQITNQLAELEWVPALLVDGSQFTAFHVVLGGATVTTFRNGVAGNLYTFVIEQPGGAIFTNTWGAGIFGGSDAYPSEGGRLVQTFLCRADGSLDATGGGSYL